MNTLATTSAITIRKPPGSRPLPDNAQWKNRFEIRSASSNRVYTVAQNKASGKWGCSCPGYLAHRNCKHLTQGCGLLPSQIHGRDRIEEKKREKFGD
jgi:hypothetical protein